MAQEEYFNRSRLLAILPDDAEEPDISNILDLLEISNFNINRTEINNPNNIPGSIWKIECQLTDKDNRTTQYIIWAEESKTYLNLQFDWHGITGYCENMNHNSKWCIGLSTKFQDSPLTDFHRQIKVLIQIAPETLFIMDLSACKNFPSEWANQTALSKIPPPPDSLYTIHCAVDSEDSEVSNNSIWLHTHGLNRCNLIEIEALDITEESAVNVANLIKTIAGFMLENGVPPKKKIFHIDHRLSITWLPWKTGIKKFPSSIPGSKKYRDDLHNFRTGILFAVKKYYVFPKYENLNKLNGLLSENPIVHISTNETDRMKSLAFERLEDFINIFTVYKEKKEWEFLIKLGYQADNTNDETGNEHLWFQIHNYSMDEVEATLLNEPYNIAAMYEGQRDIHKIDNLTNWFISTPHGNYNPDSVYELKRIINS